VSWLEETVAASEDAAPVRVHLHDGVKEPPPTVPWPC
jgi:hypothetical protein